ncbi:hypothetical protein JAAARDRAFT_30730, partial [Jaapia argillacea MUCL 33604]
MRSTNGSTLTISSPLTLSSSPTRQPISPGFPSATPWPGVHSTLGNELKSPSLPLYLQRAQSLPGGSLFPHPLSPTLGVRPIPYVEDIHLPDGMNMSPMSARFEVSMDDGEDSWQQHQRRRVPPSIKRGTYIAFSLSKDLIFHAFNSPEARKRIEQVKMGKYLGLVTDSSAYIHDGGVVEELIVSYVSTSPPPPLMKHFADHYVPISPSPSSATNRRSDDSHAPLRTNILFPLPNAKQWTTLGTRLLVHHSQLHPSSLSFRLDQDDFGRVEEAGEEESAKIAVEMDMDIWENAMREEGEDEGRGESQEAGWSREELEMAGKLQIPTMGIPVEVWEDVRVGVAANGCDPAMFIKEIQQIF